MEGFVKIHRNLIHWQWYKKSEMVHLFIHLLLSANHKAGEWQGIAVKRGQVITGRIRLSKITGLSEQRIRSCLKRLISTNEITIESTNQYSIITICNYDKYNDKKAPYNLHNNQQTNHQLTTNKNDKKVYNSFSEKVNIYFLNLSNNRRNHLIQLGCRTLLHTLRILRLVMK